MLQFRRDWYSGWMNELYIPLSDFRLFLSESVKLSQYSTSAQN